MEQLALVERKKHNTHKAHIYNKKKVINAVKAHLVAYPGDKVGDIAKYYGMHSMNVSAHKARLTRLGLISRDTMVTDEMVSDLSERLHGAPGKDTEEKPAFTDKVKETEKEMATAKRARKTAKIENPLASTEKKDFVVCVSVNHYWLITSIAQATNDSRTRVLDGMIDYYIKNVLAKQKP